MVALIRTFHLEMKRIDAEGARAIRTSSGVFSRMIGEHSGVGAAKRLLVKLPDGQLHDGLVSLLSVGRLDLSLEALVLQPRFGKLFTKAELDEAERRLLVCGYAVGYHPTPRGPTTCVLYPRAMH